VVSLRQAGEIAVPNDNTEARDGDAGAAIA